jgi:hypothetical protein
LPHVETFVTVPKEYKVERLGGREEGGFTEFVMFPNVLNEDNTIKNTIIYIL